MNNKSLKKIGDSEEHFYDSYKFYKFVLFYALTDAIKFICTYIFSHIDCLSYKNYLK